MHALPLPKSCVQISPSSHLPDKITLNLNGSLWKQAIAYDWKPKACIDCNTFSHESSSCPHNLNPVRQTRGRCRSRPPRPQLKRNTTTSTPNTLYAPLPNSSIPSFANPTLNDLSQPSILSPTIPNLLDDHIPSTSYYVTTRSTALYSPLSNENQGILPLPNTLGKKSLDYLDSLKNEETLNNNNKNRKKR